MDDFSDDDFDTLNANALQELENNAIQFTQAQKKYDEDSSQQALFDYDFEDDDLDDAVVQDELHGNPILPPTKSAQPVQPPVITNASTYAASAARSANVTTTTTATTTATERIVPQQQKSWGQPPPPRPGHGSTNQFRPQPVTLVSSVSRPSLHLSQQRQNQPHQLGRQPLGAGAGAVAIAGAVAGVRSSQQQQLPHHQLQQRQAPTIVAPPPFSQIRPHPPPSLSRPGPPVPSRYQASQQPPRPTGPTSHELAALQAQILDLQARLNTKDGEIQIVRSRLDKSRNDHERELQALKKQTSEQIAKHERAIEAAKVAERTASTELEFTKRDLREELDRVKRKDAPATPKKNAAAKSWGIADGFEDVEMAGSPTKGQRGRTAGAVANAMVEPPARMTRTPTKGKRKRLAIDSPINTLETHSEEAIVVDRSGSNDNIVEPQVTLVPHGPTFDYLKIILNHSAAHGRSLVFDYLAGFALSSRPTESLASILFQKLAAIGNPNDPMRMPIEFCEQVIQLWEACRKESCLEPITELVSLITITLQLHTAAVAPYIAPSLIPIAMESCYDVGIPRFNNTNPGDPTDESWIKFNRNIPTTRILSLLYLTALGCAASPPVAGGVTPPISDYWSEIHVQFILMMLSPKHPVEDFLVVLRLLCTSVFPQSIGPTPPGQTAEFTAAHVIERVSLQLVELPRWDLDKAMLCGVRNEILKTLVAFARSEFGLLRMAASDCIVPRLVSLIYASIDDLYDGDMQYMPPVHTTIATSTAMSTAISTNISTPKSKKSTSSSTSDITISNTLFSSSSSSINKPLSDLLSHAVLLLHTIIIRSPTMISQDPKEKEIIDVPTKLSRIMGGPQKYLLCLARLNFAETDDGMITEETAELAHELLELAVTEEEGEELGVYFGGLT